ncbi:hypothetical protein [Chryseobacterium wangxinyae]|uniref:hypothetical protein n=1 Tax=Chryseobacterium sp. CY353 TaxID=2997334 RepID=UPI002270E005|nr:hypothetical protein [Chryseobacterium sp. CY353]MCY0969449.1 hypothetical protein [Chryseobacterium sp. CY353]
MYEIYLVILFFCLVLSFINEVARCKYLGIYFIVVFISELLIYFEILNRNNYDWLNELYTVFFCWYYLIEFVKKSELIFVTLILLIVGYLFINERQNLVIIQASVYILVTANWFYRQVKSTNEVPIYKKLNFWISTSLLLWSCVYIFRILPSYFFANEDINFLENTINIIYQSMVILSYLIFLKGLCCKQ